jgi:hypothetical protein
MSSSDTSASRTRCLACPACPAHGFELAARRRAQLADAVELAGGLGKVVVQLGQLFDLDGVDGDLHVGQLSGRRPARQLGTEGLALARGHPGECGVQAVQHRLAAHLVGVPGGLRVLDRRTVDGGSQVDGDEVARLRGPVHRPQRCEALPQRAQVLLDLIGIDVSVLDRHRERVKVGQVEARPHVHLRGERQLFAVVQPGDLHLGLADRDDVVLRDGLAVQLRHRVVDRLLEHHAAADPHVDHPRWHMAWAETRHPDLTRHLPVRLVQVRLELFERDFDGQPDPGRAQILDVGLHLGSLPGNRCRRWLPAVPAKSRTAPSCSPATGDDHGNSPAKA